MNHRHVKMRGCETYRQKRLNLLVGAGGIEPPTSTASR